MISREFLLIGVFSLISLSVAVSQSSEQNASRYPFINFNSNKLGFYGDSTQFNRVFEKVDSMAFLGTGNLAILHIGGSHVQGGTLQRTMRAKFVNIVPEIGGERGFFFPYKMAHSNMPADFKLEYTGSWTGCRCAKKSSICTWGMSGFNATTTENNSHIKIYMQDEGVKNYRFNKIRIFYQLDNDSYSTQLDSIYGGVISKTDSVGQFVEYSFDKTYDTLSFSVVKTDSLQTHFTLRGIQYITNEPGITYHTIGVNGASVPAYLRCDDFEKELSYLAPDLVIFGIGINDANGPVGRFSQESYEGHYRELIDWFKKANPEVNFIFITNNDSYYRRRYPNQNVYKVVKAMQNLAKEYDAAVWNLFEIMGGIGSIKLWQKTSLAKADKIHFTTRGYQLQSDLFFEAFQNAYGEYIKRTSKIETVD
jgi:lysophospholipase L1-like esterase